MKSICSLSQLAPLVVVSLAAMVSNAAVSASDVLLEINAETQSIAIKPGTTAPIVDRNGLLVIGNKPNLDIEVKGVAEGKIQTTANNFDLKEIDFASSFQIELPKQGSYVLSFRYTPSDESKKPFSSSTFTVIKDTTGPTVRRVTVVEDPGVGTTLLIRFAENDLDRESVPNSFEVFRQQSLGQFDEPVSPVNPSDEDQTVRIPLNSAPAGQYLLLIKDSLVDRVNNKIVGATEKGGTTAYRAIFSILPGQRHGEHIEFTPFAPPQKQEIPDEGFNPGDYVETRVARLFYFRDAHRVAQIINRNTRSYNQAAVTHAERRAQESRDEANDAEDDRRRKERLAVRAAQQARQAENKLADAQQFLADSQRLENDIALNQREQQRIRDDGTLTDAQKQQQLNEINGVIARQEADLARTFGSEEQRDNLAEQIPQMEQSVANLRGVELQARDDQDDAEAIESRRRATQFRNEVTAAEADPDTYVPGDMKSVDPVTQVSISVIGEGLIQMRGPIKGINKIRTMINQIDSPVGQIKIGVFTVQVNGEEGDKMERVVGDSEGHIDMARFLVNQSLNLLRRSIQAEAAMVAEQCEMNGHYQVDRDRRYLYAFFGRDFIDELYEMNSEFLFTENKLLSLHAMDTISFNRAMFILALAKNDIRERIVTRFLESAKTELADAEYDYRRSSELRPHRTQKFFPPWNRTHLPHKNNYKKEQQVYEAVHRNALQRYHFRNFRGFFDAGFTMPDTINPMQREFIRLAQIFKARLVSEIELKQRVMERGLIEDRSSQDDFKFNLLQPIHQDAIRLEAEAQEARIKSFRQNAQSKEMIQTIIDEVIADSGSSRVNDRLVREINDLKVAYIDKTSEDEQRKITDSYKNEVLPRLKRLKKNLETTKERDWATPALKDDVSTYLTDINSAISSAEAFLAEPTPDNTKSVKSLRNESSEKTFFPGVESELRRIESFWAQFDREYAAYALLTENAPNGHRLAERHARLQEMLIRVDNDAAREISRLLRESHRATEVALGSERRVAAARDLAKKTRADLDYRKLLDHMIDDQEDKFIELVEGSRSHISVMDQYLKRLSIALEDDFKVQFYDPAFVRVRDAARACSVNLSQVERTTILTNNRDFAKVDPQAMMEFDLPKRQIAIKEAFDAAKALVEDTGALVNDPTFLSAFQMMGGSRQPTTVKNLVPGQSLSTDQQIMGLVPPPPGESSPGSALQSLVPEPSIYKLETGTGFQIRPVMQPDGDSVVFDFDYMYTTNIREPVRADEKHIGRIKRHFVHTAVQTGNFELREVSRYQVALKVSRTSRGVPLLEDIPIVGAAFRPAPSDESSLQQNIIFGQTNVYPTLYDLMGLRWAQQVVDLDHATLLESEHVVRGRQKSMRDFVFQEASRRVDDFLDVQNKSPQSYRTDFYHSQSISSPHHPKGYSHPVTVPDPSGGNFERSDRRPPEYQDPPFDRYRHRPVRPERIAPRIGPRDDMRPSSIESRPQPSVIQPAENYRYRSDSSLPTPVLVDPQYESLLLNQPDRSSDQGRNVKTNDGSLSTLWPVPKAQPIRSNWKANEKVLPVSYERGNPQPRVRRLPPIR